MNYLGFCAFIIQESWRSWQERGYLGSTLYQESLEVTSEIVDLNITATDKASLFSWKKLDTGQFKRALKYAKNNTIREHLHF